MTYSGRASRRVVFGLMWAVAWLCTASLSAQTPKRVGYVFSDGNLPGTLRAYQRLADEHDGLSERLELVLLSESTFDTVDPRRLAGVDVLVLDIMNQGLVDRFRGEHGVDLIANVAAGGTVLAVGEGLEPRDAYLERGCTWNDRARAFWQEGGADNQLGLLELAATEAGIEGLSRRDPQPSLEFGYYERAREGEATGRVFATWDELEAWRAENLPPETLAEAATRPRLAVGFYQSTYATGDTVLLDAVIAEIERQGARAVAVFGYPAAAAFEGLLVDGEGQSRVDAALAFIFRFADFEAGKTLIKVGVPIVSLVSLYGRTEQEWREEGLSLFEGTFQVAVPELAGLVAPTVVGSREQVRDAFTGLLTAERRAISERVRTAVARARRYAELRRTPNDEKRVALLFYNYPPGKAGIGASYLNVAESLSEILTRLQDEGYDLGENAVPDARELEELLASKVHNVGSYAPGELAGLIDGGHAEIVDFATYETWLESLDETLRKGIQEDWGDPRQGNVMVSTREPEGLVIPVLTLGNVLVMPQPLRGWGEDLQQLYHAEDLAPPHQYVATYLWLERDARVDAVVHMGTHGTLEWLDGKDLGLSPVDAPDALISELPNLNVYNVDVVGEGLIARRRGMATLIDHMVPPFKPGGLYPELAELSERINDYHANEHKNPELAKAYAADTKELVVRLGIAKDLELDLEGDRLEHDVVHQIQAHLAELRRENIPYGLHAFGRLPEKELRRSTVAAIVGTDRSALGDDRTVLTRDMDERIVASAARELDSLVAALAGGFVPTGSGGEPIRNPDAYPTGKNFYGIDPGKVPKKAAWRLGVQLADEMLRAHVEEHGRYPEKVSFVIWGDETMRHEGVLESQIFHLLGTRPVWDARDKVVDVEVLSREELGRPRIDIVISSAAEGMFHNVTQLMDKAVQLVKLREEADNFVRRHVLETTRILTERGYSPEEAERRAGVRIFDEPPGRYNLNTSRIAAQSGSWESDRALTDEYLSKMGHGFGNGFWGEPMEDVFRLALSGTEKVVHSSSTMLYGALDNDDMLMYVGGLAASIRNIDGADPDVVVTNTRDPSRPEVTSMAAFLGKEYRTRYVNPTWIEGMQEEGYAGAGEMRAFVEYLWGWDATVSDLVSEDMWQQTFEVYVEDKYELEMKEFFEESSPHAFQDIVGRMVETSRKGYWRPDEETERRLLEELTQSVRRHGVGCSVQTCGNAKLLRHVVQRARELDVPYVDLEGFRQAVEEALDRPIDDAAREADRFTQANEPESNRFTESGGRSPSIEDLENLAPEDLESGLSGYRMITRQNQQQPTETRGARAAGSWGGLWFGVPVLGFLLVWRWREGG